MVTLGRLHEAGEPAVPRLAKIAEGDDASLSIRSLWTLHSIGAASGASVDSLVRIIDAPSKAIDSPEKLPAILTLGRLGAVAEPGVPALTRVMENKRSFYQQKAILAIAQIGPHAHVAIPALTKYLQERGGYQCDAVRALSAIGLDIPLVRDAVIDALGDDHTQLRDAAAAVILPHATTWEVALTRIRVAAESDDVLVRRRSAQSVIALGSQAEPLVNAMAALLDDPDRLTRAAAAQAVKAIGSSANDAIPLLLECARDDPDPSVRALAQSAIDAINGSPKDDS